MNIQCLIEAQHDIFHNQNWLTMMISIDGELLYQKVHTGNQREPVKRNAEDVKMVPECREWARRVYYGAEVVNYPDSYFLSPAPHATPPPLYCLPDEGLWSAKYSLLTLNCENNARVVVLTFPMLPHLNRPGYCFHRFQGKTLLEKEVPVFIKQLFRLPVISPPPVCQYAAGCSDWVATSKFGIRSSLNPTKAGRLNACVSEQRGTSLFEGLSLTLTLFHKHTTPAVVAVPAGLFKTLQIAKLSQLSWPSALTQEESSLCTGDRAKEDVL